MRFSIMEGSLIVQKSFVSFRDVPSSLVRRMQCGRRAHAYSRE
jgi:hypothetical protein